MHTSNKSWTEYVKQMRTQSREGVWGDPIRSATARLSHYQARGAQGSNAYQRPSDEYDRLAVHTFRVLTARNRLETQAR